MAYAQIPVPAYLCAQEFRDINQARVSGMRSSKHSDVDACAQRIQHCSMALDCHRCFGEMWLTSIVQLDRRLGALLPYISCGSSAQRDLFQTAQCPKRSLPEHQCAKRSLSEHHCPKRSLSERQSRQVVNTIINLSSI